MTHKVRLKDYLNRQELDDFKKLGKRKQKKAIDKMANILNDGIQDYLDSSKSPASGGKFKPLLKDGTASQLFDQGDLRNSFEYEQKNYGFEFGVYEKDEAIKAYGHHTNMKGHPTLQGKVGFRQILPKDDNGKFKAPIERKMKKALKDIINEG